MARTTSFTKRSLISKANSTIVIATTVAAFVLVFTLVAGKSLLNQAAYQNRVIDAKKTALERLEADLEARDQLQEAYDDFVADDPNVLAGSPDGNGEQDGDNARIVLDALPSRYDFPALTTSLERLVTSQNLKIVSISGTDQEATEGAKSLSTNPTPVAMPFQVQVNGTYEGVQNLIDVFLRSIWPFQIQTIELTGDEGNMNARIEAQTFYQAQKDLKITTEVVK
jgi:hypothetical protein